MSPKTKNAQGAITSTDTQAGPDAYAAGGFTIETNLGRTDTYNVEVNSEAYEARVTDVVNNGELNVQVYEMNFTDGAVDEVADGTDLSGVEFIYEATRL